MFLLDDPNGTRVVNIEYEHRGDAVQINTEILREWATGRGKKPVTWETLTEVLLDIGLSALASEIDIGLQEPEEEVDIPFETHSEGMPVF